MQFSVQAREVESVDVLVAGGGPAGCAAAIAARRRGLSVLLVEATSALGGTATGETPVVPVGNVQKIVESNFARFAVRGYDKLFA